MSSSSSSSSSSSDQYYSVPSPLAVLSHWLFTNRAAKAVIMTRPVAENVGST